MGLAHELSDPSTPIRRPDYELSEGASKVPLMEPNASSFERTVGRESLASSRW